MIAENPKVTAARETASETRMHVDDVIRMCGPHMSHKWSAGVRVVRSLWMLSEVYPPNVLRTCNPLQSQFSYRLLILYIHC